MAKGPRRLKSPKYNFQCLINALTWSIWFCGERGKRGGMVGKNKGPWQRNAIIIILMKISGGLYTQLFPLGKAHKAGFQHLFDVMNLEKHVLPLCAYIIGKPMRHIISSMPYP